MVNGGALAIVATVIVGTVVFALINARRVRMSPQEYIVGGRGFGAVFLWVLLAGEIYTSFTFLGAAGWTYGYGAPAFYIIAYGACGYILGYFLLPAIHRYARERNLLTSPDFLVSRYRSKTLGVLASVILCVADIPYITLQLSGLELFLTIAGYGKINAQTGAVLGFLLIVAFVYVTGLRGTAWASIVKDALVIGALLFVGLAIPIHFFGSPAAMFDQILRAHPAQLTLQSVTGTRGEVWFVSTVLLTAIGFYMGPQSIAAVYSAKDDMTLRRNAVFLPIYQLAMLLVFFAGFSALLIVPGQKGPNVDQSFLLIVQRYYPAWVLGFVVAAGALCSLVPSTALLLSTASILSKNILGDVFGIALEDRSRVVATRLMVLCMGLLSLTLWLTFKTTLVDLLLLTYNGLAQFAPGFILGLAWKRTSALGVGAGIVAGVALAVYLAATGTSPWGMNPGFIGLALNVAIVTGISLLTKEESSSHDELSNPVVARG